MKKPLLFAFLVVLFLSSSGRRTRCATSRRPREPWTSRSFRLPSVVAASDVVRRPSQHVDLC